jgi:hypothetical protein
MWYELTLTTGLCCYNELKLQETFAYVLGVSFNVQNEKTTMPDFENFIFFHLVLKVI